MITDSNLSEDQKAKIVDEVINHRMRHSGCVVCNQVTGIVLLPMAIPCVSHISLFPVLPRFCSSVCIVCGS